MIAKENSKHYFWGENCDSWVLLDTESLSIKQENMPSGTKERLHFHTKAQQFFYVLKGTATFYIENQKQIISENQGILVLPNTNHFIANETLDNLEFIVTSQPSTNNDRTEIE
jgi:mannose-6-phosphate isomerase-like protein (cupin superfamily)